ncbi:MAG: 23S rRNA (guanosine(2251)-2'-O)-methyltransferase RlmB [Actinomycetota bacterium]|nr:23S rRNA (guanosine(2251)-2'-O)-methyltransferase RlmB [Actinomycetota bacterium]
MAKNRDKNYERVYGINPVYSLVRTNAGKRKIYEILISSRRKKDLKVTKIIKEAVKQNIDIKEFTPSRSDDTLNNINGSQGVYAVVSPYNYSNLGDFMDKETGSKSSGKLRLIILDGVTDVGNFGSIIRNCHAFGFKGIIIPKRRSVAVSERVSKISAGALEEVKIFRIVNTTRTIKELKKRGFWIYGTTLDIKPGVKSLDEVSFTFPMALILGSEDKGISRLVSSNCDIMISIKLSGRMQSLNVSVASGIILYRIQEQIEGRD